MTEAVIGLQPNLLWKHFAGIAEIPRPSKHEAAVARYVQDVARRAGATVKTDRVGNMLFQLPATPGREGAPLVCMQGHLDMVCEKNQDTKHDFNKDPIVLKRDGEVLRARGTTLGADNGIGVAAMLAVMDDKSLVHGPLEFLLTVEEEVGLTGARNLDNQLMSSRILINLDSEEEGALYVGCAGGRDTVGTWDLQIEDLPEKMQAFGIRVRGLKGGHSGLDIDKQRGNAIKILSRLLGDIEKMGIRIASMNGGSKRNAIAREAQAQLFVPTAKWAATQDRIRETTEILKAEFQAADPGLSVEVEIDTVKKGKVLTRILQKRLLRLLDAIPHGVLKMSYDLKGLVQTSTNVAVLNTGRKLITLGTNQRSSVASELDAAVRATGSILHLAGASVESSVGYPGWQPNMNSPALSLAKHTYQKVFGKDPAIKAIHAGLECGIIGEKYAGVDMISFGPTIVNAHSPDENVNIPSVEKFWHFLREMLSSYATL